jgi:phosphopantothenoylcysteine decarboxylase/phosphopantothenate--cysteine ligase
MSEAVLSACRDADVLLMAAAVADFRPAQAAQQKLKKDRGLPVLALEPTADILASVARQREAVGKPEVVVGFAAETENLMANAQAKVRAKALDLIVANDITALEAGFAVDTNRVTLNGAPGEAEALPLLSKTEVAARVIEQVIARLSAKGI